MITVFRDFIFFGLFEVSMCYSLLSTSAGPIQCVSCYLAFIMKARLHLDAGLSWTTHINTSVSKASKWLYFLKQLRRAGVSPQQLLHFYTAVIRPVLKRASPVWHYSISITRAQSQHLESNKKRAVHIIFSFTRGMLPSRLKNLLQFQIYRIFPRGLLFWRALYTRVLNYLLNQWQKLSELIITLSRR